ncbi:acyltransferase family protein [Streptomyces sp. V4I2]|uniref:acyltransferase family protein n=1 Tax=Streptomyces sp. V4I2 TaxID=3042280 RepID=UPI0035936DAD
MLLDGYLRAEVGGDQRVRDGASANKVPDKIPNGGPIVSFRGGQATTLSVPDKTIALTFDDGPNPTYTPRVLEILEKYDIPATFFVVGSMVSRYSGSMGIMFGLAGTLMAKSLERPPLTVVKSRLRRLLPPFWFWGFFVVVAMLVHGWMPGRQIVYWIVPLGDPPGNEWGVQAWEILWYLRTYLWFVLLSPLLLKVFRLAPVPVLLLSLCPILVLTFLWSGPDNRLGSALWDLSTYLFCWLLGFAHRDGVLRRTRPAVVVVLSLAAMGYGGWYAVGHQAEFGTYDLDGIPLAQAFWSAGFVLLLMWAKARCRIDFAGLTRFRRLDRLVTVFNARAVTIYLWHEIALILTVPLIDRFWQVPAFETYLPLESQWFMFGVGWILIAGFVLGCGWVEDVAARRKPRLLP